MTPSSKAGMLNSNRYQPISCGGLQHIVALDLPGFTKTVPPGSVHQLMFDSVPAESLFQQFVGRVLQSIGRQFLPVYRMADGEFMFAVGPHAALNTKGHIDAWSYAKVKSRHILARLPWGSRYGSVSTIWGESYPREEMSALRADYLRYVSEIARDGILAVHFVYSQGRFGEQYIQPMCRWLDRNGIILSRDNYTSFYFVYALLNGPLRRLLLRNRSIAVVSSANQDKQDRIAAALLAEGATKVQFVNISPTRAMTETVDLSGLRLPIDVVLVAAGIGSANILVQLRPLSTLCIDSGICIECLAQPDRKSERIFLLSDEDMAQAAG